MILGVLLVGIHLSPFNVAQLGRCSRPLEDQTATDQPLHLSLICPALFMDLVTFIIRSHKAFLEMDPENSGYISRAQAAQVMRSFGGWDAHRIALHVLAALFDANTNHISPEYAFPASNPSNTRMQNEILRVLGAETPKRPF